MPFAKEVSGSAERRVPDGVRVFAPAEIVSNYADIGAKKAAAPAWKLFSLGILAGFLIGMGAAVTNTAVHSIENVSVARVVSGLLFPLGLGVVMLMGAELFTGNCMIPVSVLERRAGLGGMLKNWLIVYLGNLAGGLLLALACVYSGQLNYSAGGLALYSVRVAAGKCSLAFGPAVVLGTLCNILVCLGVLCSLSAQDTAGRILGAYIPVTFFVICGFEHSVANMYYIPAGRFAAARPAYAAQIAEAGIDTAALTWRNFFVGNLLPVTLGNILGGAGIGILLWKCHTRGIAPGPVAGGPPPDPRGQRPAG
ncbi:MAG: formate/nitrite transporter family protein [Synergistaceae bacterium]|jgi:formate/nitrite transporter|nr:formate/nitrite transporter family protein [Synergistaceae bacterium]